MVIHKLVLYGAGNRCRKLCEMLMKSDIEVAALADSNVNLWGKEMERYRISPPEVLEEYNDMYFCITLEDNSIAAEIREKLQNVYHFKLENEVSYKRTMLQAYARTYTGSQIFTQGLSGVESEGSKEESILFDCYKGLGLGGVETWTMDLCQALIKEGKKNIFIISDKGDYEIPPALENSVLYTDIDHTKRFLESSIRNIMGVILRKLPCKVITCVTDEVMVAAYIIKCHFPGMVEIISVIHSSIEWLYVECMDFRDCPNLYVSVSQDIRNDLIGRGIRPEEIKAMTCPFPCEKNLTRSYSEDISMPIKIGFAGRMEYHQKRMDLWLKLINRLADKQVSFIIEFAGDGIAVDEMKEFVHENHLEEKVHFLGKLDHSDIPGFWKRQDICVNLADFEGRSISIIEAMGNGTIPVVTHTSGVREDITDGLNGYIIPVGDYMAAAERIAYLADHRERLNEMGHLAHGTVYPKSRMESHLKFWDGILFGMRGA